MKACEALIAYTPNEIDCETRGLVEVGPLIGEDDFDWTENFSFTTGAAYTHIRELRGAESVSELFRTFARLVTLIGLSPYIVDAAFMQIDEYRESMEKAAVI